MGITHPTARAHLRVRASRTTVCPIVIDRATTAMRVTAMLLVCNQYRAKLPGDNRGVRRPFARSTRPGGAIGSWGTT